MLRTPCEVCGDSCHFDGPTVPALCAGCAVVVLLQLHSDEQLWSSAENVKQTVDIHHSPPDGSADPF